MSDGSGGPVGVTPLDLDPILEQIEAGDPVGAAYRLSQVAGDDAPGQLFYEAGSVALSRRAELGEEALRFARLAFAEAVERDPRLGEAHHDLATTMRELGMAEDAAAHYRKALDILPQDVDSLIGLGAALCDLGKLDDAVDILIRATEAHPESGLAFANLGVALEATGRDAEAAAAYAQAGARFDAELTETSDEEVAGEIAVRRRWARIQHAEVLERLELWPQAIVEFRRLYEEERDDEDDEDDEDDDGDAGLLEGAAEPEEGGAGQEHAGHGAAHGHGHAHEGHEHAHQDEDDDDDEEMEAGRLGMERLFARMVQLRRYDLAYLLLDELGGELSDARTRADYAIFEGEAGVPMIMVQNWDDETRERLDPSKPASRRRGKR